MARDTRLNVAGGGGVMAAAAVSRGPAPSEPFTGYAAVLRNSRYLRPAQQMLDQICDAGGRTVALVCADSDPIEVDLSVPDGLSGGGDGSGAASGSEQRRIKTKLISMLEEVYRRYKQYYQQIQAIVTSFDSVAGLNNAAPYTCLALKSMSKHFQSLKYAISEQLRCADRAHGKDGHSKEGLPGFGLMNGGFCYQGASHSSGAIGQQHVWRPQRGLPERAVAVLKAWLFEHFLHPYPTDTDKHMLAKQTGLSRNQVSNWFINARVRLWKPLVEEIHSLEMRQGHKNNSNAGSNNGQPASSTDRQSNKQQQQHMQNVIGEKSHSPPPKRFRDEFDDIPSQIDEAEPLSFGFDDFSSHHHRMGTACSSLPTSGGNGGISLTLGLHQNNGSICLSSDQFPLNIARRFGIEESGAAAYGMGGLEVVQDRHFGKEIDGQLLHDFVG